MQEFYNRIHDMISEIIEKGIMQNLVIEDDIAYTIDPIFGISRTRVDAEFIKCLLRIKIKNKNYTPIIEKLLKGLVKKQNIDGSWNEVHVKYDQPSALNTAIVGEALIDGYIGLKYKKTLENHIHRAKDFIIQNEISSGYFRKSAIYVADHLNVDATCGAFLAKYGQVFSDIECLEVARRAARHICDHQFPDGAIPYTTLIKGNYRYHFQIPCIHYQGVTLYYLIKINDVLKIDWLDMHLKKGINWLESVQYDDGRFDWSKSGLMFSYYLSGAYAFAISSFIYGSKYDAAYEYNAGKAIDVLKANINGIANRWERASMYNLPFSLFSTFRTAFIGEYPLLHRMYRFGYGMYRQAARRRFASTVNPRMFNLLSSIMGINASTIEPDNNFPDLFMTSEISDCLSYTMEKNL